MAPRHIIPPTPTSSGVVVVVLESVCFDGAAGRPAAESPGSFLGPFGLGSSKRRQPGATRTLMAPARQFCGNGSIQLLVNERDGQHPSLGIPLRAYSEL